MGSDYDDPYRIRAEQLRRRVYQIERLAAMPQVAWQLMQVMRDEWPDPDRLETIIASDQALAAKVLSLANSVYYGLMEKTTTIQRAIVVIGYRELQFLALGAGLAGVFDLRQVPPGLDADGLWLHCLTVSWLARELATASGHPSPAEVMIAGLLHDLGLLVLATHLKDELVKILELMDRGLPFYQAEEVLGLSHATIGFWLAQRWNLPEVHAAAIRDHHAPKPDDPNFPTTCLVSLADELAKKLDFGLAYKARPLGQPIPLEAIRLNLLEIRSVASKAVTLVPPMLDSWRLMLT
ncbi:MAG: HDOD domain-containing protein [Thermodesulfobacteriota bacterium]